MAAPPPPPGGGGAPPLLPVPAPVLHSYVDYLNDASNDPYASLTNGYTDVLAPFHIDVNNANNNLAPDQVRSLIVGARGAVPLLLLHNNRVHVYLQPSRFEPRLGLTTTPWDDSMFVTKGDLHNNSAVTANWIQNYFHQQGQQMTIPTLNTVVNGFAADPTLVAFGPYNANDAGTEIGRVRFSCFCPASYAALLLPALLSPRTAFERVHAQVVNDGRLAQCETLLRWLRMALLVNANGSSPIEVAAPTAPLADHLLLDHRRQILERDFPLLNRQLPQIQQHQIASQIGILVADNQAHRASQEAQKLADKNKSPTSLFGATGVAKLCRFLRVPDERAFPETFRRLASASRHNRLAELQWALDAERNRLDFIRMQFVATPSLLNKVVNCSWEMEHIDSITTGIQPYLFGDVTPEESQQMNSMYQMVMAGNAAPSLQDAAALMSPNKPSLPRVLFQTREMLQRLLIFYNVFLQPVHQMSINIHAFLRDFTDRESFLHYYEPITPGYRLCMPLLVIQWMTVRIDTWYRDQAVTDVPIPAPNFGRLFQLIDHREQWEPHLPAALLHEFQPPAQQFQFGGMGQQGIGGGGGQNPGQTVRSAGGNAGGGISGNTGGGDGGDNQIPNQAIRNPNYKVSLFGRFRDMNINHRELRRNMTVPLPPSPYSTTGGEMCLSYHGKGICNLRCSRASDHQPHTDAQDQPLITWMEANYHL